MSDDLKYIAHVHSFNKILQNAQLTSTDLTRPKAKLSSDLLRNVVLKNSTFAVSKEQTEFLQVKQMELSPR